MEPLRTPSLLRRPGFLETAVLTILGIIVVVGLLTITTSPPTNMQGAAELENWQPGGYLALAIAVTGICLAYWHPWPGIILVAASPIVSSVLEWDPTTTWNLAIFTTLWLTLRSLPGLPVGLLVGVTNFTAVGLVQGGFSLEEPVPSIAGIAALAAAGTGSAIRGHRRYWGELERRTQEALATREAEAERRVAEERVRIARDLHDVVGHEVALVSMHLGAAEIHLPAEASMVRQDLIAVRTGVQAVLAGTQQILKVLRAGPDDESGPTAGYDHIMNLVHTAREAGLAVESTVGETSMPLSPAVSAAAYRIVQEALTNAHRHGTGAVSLRVKADQEAVTIEAVNVYQPSQTSEANRNGYGLVGMRERAASVGGWIDTQEDDHMFWLWAYLPLDEGDNR